MFNNNDKPFYKTKIFLAVIIIVVLALAYYMFTRIDAAPVAAVPGAAVVPGTTVVPATVAARAVPATPNTTTVAARAVPATPNTTTVAARAVPATPNTTTTAAARAAAAAARAAAAAARAASLIKVDKVVNINTLKTINPTFDKQLALTALLQAKSAAYDLLSHIGNLNYITAISASNESSARGSGRGTWLANTVGTPAAGTSDTFQSHFDKLVVILNMILFVCNSNLAEFSTSCDNLGYSKSALKALNIIKQINAETTTFATKYMGVAVVNGEYTTIKCAIGKACGYLSDIDNLIKSDSLHAPKQWLIPYELKGVETGFNKIIILLLNLLIETAWIKQFPIQGIQRTNNAFSVMPMYPTDFMYFKTHMANLPAWYAKFEQHMNTYIAGLQTKIKNVKTTGHNLGNFSGYYTAQMAASQ